MKAVYAAFINFQKELKPILKESENPFLQSKYADLSAILSEAIPLLTKHDLGIIQSCRVDAAVNVLQTKLVHTSGEEILSEIILPHNNDPQKMGSLLTYYKRYSAAAIMGITTKDEDDDGQAAKPAGKEESKNDTSRFQKSGQIKPADYVIQLGKFRGKKLAEVSATDLQDYCMELTKKNPQMAPDMQQFIDLSREHLRTLKTQAVKQ